MKKFLVLSLIASLMTPAFAQQAKPSNSGSGGQGGGGNSHSEKSTSDGSSRQQGSQSNSNNAGGAQNAGNALALSSVVTGVVFVAAGVALVWSTVKLIIKVSSKAKNAVAMNNESEKALTEIAAIYNAKGYNVTNAQVEDAIYTVMDENSDTDASWNALFNNPETFSAQVFTKLTGEAVAI